MSRFVLWISPLLLALGCASAGPSDSDPAVLTVAFSADSKRLAAAGEDKHLRIWSVEGGELLHDLELPEAIWKIAYSPDGTLLAAAYKDSVRLYDATTPRQLGTLDHPAVSDIVFGKRGDLAVTAGGDCVKVWSFAPDALGKAVLTFEVGRVWTVALTGDEKTIVTGPDDGTVRFWDIRTGDLINFTDPWTRKTCTGIVYGGRIDAVAVSPDGKSVGTVYESVLENGHIYVDARFRSLPMDNVSCWSIGGRGRYETDAEHYARPRLSDFHGTRRTVSWLGFSRDSWFAAWGAPRCGWSRLMGMPSFTGPADYAPGAGPTFAAAFSPDGKWLATAEVGQVSLWDATDIGDGSQQRRRVALSAR